MIEYSPYDTDVQTRNFNITESSRINYQGQSSSDTLKFALFSDIHENYDDLYDAISSINQQTNLQFAACCGDITNAGLAQEFKWYISNSQNSKYPLITVIGNHDYLSNGYSVYTKLFGPTNISFIVNKYKFILFDNIIWEKNNEMPDYEWLSHELADSTHYNVLLAHIPPFSEEMEGDYGLKYNQTVDSTNTVLCIHGHTHSFSETSYNGIHTIISTDIEDREYYIISLINGKSFIKRISY